MPDRTAEIFALLYPAGYAHVPEIRRDGWYRIDAGIAEPYTPQRGLLPDTGFRDVAARVAMNAGLSPASEDGWVNGDGDDRHAYLNKVTGELITISDDDIAMAKNDEAHELSEWQDEFVQEYREESAE